MSGPPEGLVDPRIGPGVAILRREAIKVRPVELLDHRSGDPHAILGPHVGRSHGFHDRIERAAQVPAHQ
jgi:hypothetical protein